MADLGIDDFGHGHLAREVSGGGRDLMQFFPNVFDGKPFMRKMVVQLPLRKDGTPRAKPYVEVEMGPG